MKIKLNSQAARAHIMACAAAGVAEGAGALLAAAQAACPVDTGRLKGSGFVQAGGTQARVGFSAPYAAIVHERQHKFLEQPANDSGVQAEMLSRIVRRMVV